MSQFKKTLKLPEFCLSTYHFLIGLSELQTTSHVQTRHPITRLLTDSPVFNHTSFAPNLLSVESKSVLCA